MSWTLEQFRSFLSEKLLEKDLNSVMQEIERMQRGDALIVGHHEDALLQGDVYDGVPLITRGPPPRVDPRRVLLISNSCDSSPENARAVPLDLIFAPLLRMSRYRQMLLDNGVAQPRVESTLAAIKQQRTTSVVYLPAGGGLQEDMVVLLDKVQSLPFSEFNAAAPARLAVLTQRGFWVLLIKLSMHFLRPHEGVPRAA